MDQLKEYYKELGVSGEVYDYAKNIESSLSERFAEFDAVAEFNQLKVLKAMKKNRISEAHLGGTTGYGMISGERRSREFTRISFKLRMPWYARRLPAAPTL